MRSTALRHASDVVRNRPLNERQVFMAMTHINRWLVADGKKLTKLQIVTLRLAVIADIKEARPTVRAKRPVQQLKTDKPLCGLHSKCVESVPRYCGGKGSANFSQLGCYKYPAARSVV